MPISVLLGIKLNPLKISSGDFLFLLVIMGNVVLSVSTKSRNAEIWKTVKSGERGKYGKSGNMGEMSIVRKCEKWVSGKGGQNR